MGEASGSIACLYFYIVLLVLEKLRDYFDFGVDFGCQSLTLRYRQYKQIGRDLLFGAVVDV